MQPRGNALLVGVGGSGRKSLSRLATYVADQKCFSIEISKGYRITEFREDLKTLYRQVSIAVVCSQAVRSLSKGIAFLTCVSELVP